MSDPKKITEEMKLQEQWYKDAKNVAIETLSDFVRSLVKNYEHDYGTICHAVTASAIAAAYAVDHSKQGGITGFQASCIMWEFIRHWMHYDNKPMRLIDYDDMLYPQYEPRSTSISPETWKYLKKKAVNNLKLFNNTSSPEVIEHWKSIVAGKVPFGYKIEK